MVIKCFYRLVSTKQIEFYKTINYLKMNWKQFGIDVLVVVVGVLIATKIKEQMDRASISSPSKK